MKRDTFRDSVLGRWSSHPTAVARRTRTTAFLAIVPVVLFGIALLARIRNPANWLGMLRDAHWWIGAAAILASFTVAMLLTLALMARLNRWKSHLKHQRLPKLGWFDPWMILPAAAIAFAGPYWLANISGIGPIGMWFFRFLAFLPLMTLIAITGSTAPPDDTDAEPKRQGWLLAIASFFMLGAILTLTHDLARVSGSRELADRVERFLPWYTDNAIPFSGFLGFGTIGLVAFALWRLWYRQPTDLERTIEHHSSFKRIFGLGPELVTEPREGRRESVRNEQAGGGEGASDLREDPASSVVEAFETALFGFEPRKEQLALMTEIDRRYHAALNESDPPKANRLGDLQIHSSKDNVQTATLAASALWSYLSYGRRSIWILPDSASKTEHQQIITHFQSRLEDLSLDWLVTVSSLTFELAFNWQDGKAELPAILITTPDSLSERILDNTGLTAQAIYTFIGSYTHLYIGETITTEPHSSFARARSIVEQEGMLNQWVTYS